MLAINLTRTFNDAETNYSTSDLYHSDLFRGPPSSVHQSRPLLTSSLNSLMSSFCMPGRVVHAALARIDLDDVSGVSGVLHNEYSMLPVLWLCKYLTSSLEGVELFAMWQTANNDWHLAFINELDAFKAAR